MAFRRKFSPDLPRIRDLKVISRTASTQRFKSERATNLTEIAKQLGVANIRRRKRTARTAIAVRVNVQLIKAADDSRIFGRDTYDRDLTDIFVGRE